MSDKKVFKHLPSGSFLLLLKKHKFEINMYLECDEQGTPIKKKRAWSHQPQTQERIVTGYKNLCQVI